MAHLQQAFRTGTPLRSHAGGLRGHTGPCALRELCWRFAPQRAHSGHEHVPVIHGRCAFLCVVCALQSVPDFIKPWALLFKVDRRVSKCISYYGSPWGLFKNLPIKTLFISVLGQMLQLIFMHTCDVAVCPFSA